jgi:hypothetical protein
MTLQNFAAFIDDVILERGIDYFYDDRVTSIREESPGFFVARVKGGRDYRVEVTLGADGAIVSSYCNCPYEGTRCKHQVALYYALQKKGRLADPREPDLLSTLHDILTKRRADELVDVIMKSAAESTFYCKKLIYQFVEEDRELEVSREMLWSTIGQLPHARTTTEEAEAIQVAHMVAEKAAKHLRDGRVLQAIDLYLEIFAIASQVMPVESAHGRDDDIDYYDDDDFCDEDADYDVEGHSILEDAIGGIGVAMQAAESVLDRAGKETALARVMGMANTHLSGPHSKLSVELLLTCCELAGDGDFRSMIMDALHSFVQQLMSAEIRDYDAVYLIKTAQYELLEEEGDQDKMTDFLMANLGDNYFLRLAVLRAARFGDHHSVLRLSGVGRDRDPHDRDAPWRQFQLNAHEELGNVDAARSLAFELLVREGFDYYPRLKGLYSAQEWPETQLRVVEHYQHQPYVPDSYRRFLEAEKLHHHMLDLCRKDSRMLLHWYQDLCDIYQGEICCLLTKHVWDLVRRASTRNAYRDVCSVLRKHREACGEDASRRVVADILSAQPRKRALHEEISRL